MSMTPDPTTRDPAASLRACIELAAKAHEWQCTGDRIRCEDGHGCECAMANKECPDWVDACLHFITGDAAPALLAEVDELRWKVRTYEHGHEIALGTIHMGQAFIDALATDLRAAGCAVDLKADPCVTNPRAEAAEQVAREAVALLRRVDSCLYRLDRKHREYAGVTGPLADNISTFLDAHHGARTGETPHAHD